MTSTRKIDSFFLCVYMCIFFLCNTTEQTNTTKKRDMSQNVDLFAPPASKAWKVPKGAPRQVGDILVLSRVRWGDGQEYKFGKVIEKRESGDIVIAHLKSDVSNLRTTKQTRRWHVKPCLTALTGKTTHTNGNGIKAKKDKALHTYYTVWTEYDPSKTYEWVEDLRS